jgi:hypothetical protein
VLVERGHRCLRLGKPGPQPTLPGLGQLARTDHHAPLQPTVQRPSSLCGHGLQALKPRRDQLWCAVLLRAADPGHGLLPRPPRRQVAGQDRGQPWALRQRAQVIIAFSLDTRAGLQGAHLAIAPRQQPTPPQALPDAGDGRESLGIIGPLARDDVRRHRHAQGIQGRHHDFDLRQVRAMIFAMPKLEQPGVGHGPVAVGGGAIEADAGWFQVVDAQHMLIQGPLKGVPAPIVAQGLQHGGQPIVADIEPMHRLPGAFAQRVEPLFRPRFDVVQPMVGFGEDVRQPEHAHPAQAEANPVPVGGKMLVQ